MLEIDPALIVSAYEEIHAKLLRPTTKKPSGKLPYFQSLSEQDQDYLKGWFSEQVLCDLDQVARTIQGVEIVPIRNFMQLGLSNILRNVSWQKNDDLRVRKEVRLDADIDPIREFLEEIGRSVRLVLAFLYQNVDTRLGTYEVQHGDARQLHEAWAKWTGKVDVIITSPPYATALPYLDTDRLSLCYLGLLASPLHRKQDQGMIGNREITEKTRQSYWDLLEENRDHLPASVTSLITKVHKLNLNTDVGFRRRNLPALLTKYFLDMRQVLAGMKKLLRPGHQAFVVIGNNHTIAGGTRVDIDTASLLVDIAESLGFQTKDRIPMEMLVSRDIFRKNTGASEEILCFKKSD